MLSFSFLKSEKDFCSFVQNFIQMVTQIKLRIDILNNMKNKKTIKVIEKKISKN